MLCVKQLFAEEEHAYYFLPIKDIRSCGVIVDREKDEWGVRVHTADDGLFLIRCKDKEDAALVFEIITEFKLLCNPHDYSPLILLLMTTKDKSCNYRVIEPRDKTLPLFKMLLPTYRVCND